MRQATVTVRGTLKRLVRDPRRALTRLTELRPAAGPTGRPARPTANARPQGVPATPSTAPSSRRPRFEGRLRRPHLSDLAADRRGAPVLVLILVLVASLLATLPEDSGVAMVRFAGGACLMDQFYGTLCHLDELGFQYALTILTTVTSRPTGERVIC